MGDKMNIHMVDSGRLEIAEQQGIARVVGDRHRDVGAAVHENDQVSDGQQVGVGTADIDLVQAQQFPFRIRYGFSRSGRAKAAGSQHKDQKKENGFTDFHTVSSLPDRLFFRYPAQSRPSSTRYPTTSTSVVSR